MKIQTFVRCNDCKKPTRKRKGKWNGRSDINRGDQGGRRRRMKGFGWGVVDGGGVQKRNEFPDNRRRTSFQILKKSRPFRGTAFWYPQKWTMCELKYEILEGVSNTTALVRANGPACIHFKKIYPRFRREPANTGLLSQIFSWTSPKITANENLGRTPWAVFKLQGGENREY